LAPLVQLKLASGQAEHLMRTARAQELRERLLSAAEASQPRNSLIIAVTLRLIISARLVLATGANSSVSPLNVQKLVNAWQSDPPLLASSKRCLALLLARWHEGALCSASPEEVAFNADDSRPAQTLGTEAFFACTRDAIRWWPPLQSAAAEQARVHGIHGALRAALALDAAGRLDRGPNAARSWLQLTGPTFGMSVTNLLGVALQTASLLQQLRATCALSSADELALRALHVRLSTSEPDLSAYSQLHASMFAARRESGAADLARHGLRRCALPACDAQEPHPKLFKLCGRCRGAAYCCAAHSVKDWKRHKREDGCKAAP
jgi:hypothetical protein